MGCGVKRLFSGAKQNQIVMIVRIRDIRNGLSFWGVPIESYCVAIKLVEASAFKKSFFRFVRAHFSDGKRRNGNGAVAIFNNAILGSFHRWI
jgi:hypothetical protein